MNEISLRIFSGRTCAFREGLGGVSAWFCEMPRDKKDLPPEQIYSGSMKAYVLSGSSWD